MPRAFGLRAALSLLVLIAIAPVFAVVVQASLGEQRTRLQWAEAGLDSVLRLSALHQEQMIDSARQLLGTMAASPVFPTGDFEACGSYLRALRASHALYSSVGFLDARGRLVCSVPALAPDANAGDRRYLRDAVRSGRFVVGDYMVGRSNAQPTLVFAQPVFREGGGSLQGVLFAALDLQRVNRELGALGLPAEMTLFLTDRSGTVLGSAGQHAVVPGSRVPNEPLRQAIAARQASKQRAAVADGQDWLFAVQPVGREEEGSLFVAAEMSRTELLHVGMRRLQGQLGALVLISIAAGLAAWVFGDRAFVRPMAAVLRHMDELQREEVLLHTRPTPVGWVKEIHELDQRLSDMGRDLTERAVLRDGAMAEMAHQKSLLESVLEGMTEGVLVIDSRGQLLHLNQAARRMLADARAAGQDAPSLRNAFDAWRLYELDGKTPLLAGKQPASQALVGRAVESFRYLLRSGGGKDLIVQGSARPIRNPEMGLEGAVVVFSDITAAHAAELALRDSELRYRTLFDANPHPMWVYDVQTLRFLTVNDAAVVHYGYTREQFLAMTIGDIRPAEDTSAMREAVAAADGPMAPPTVWRHRLADGRLIYVEISSHSLDYDGRPARMVLAHDITRRLLAEEELRHLNESLEGRVSERTRELAVANEELESFSYSVSHDLRAPLQVIDGFSRALLARHAEKLDGQARHYLDRIRENTRHMSELIDDLLALARVTRVEIQSEPFDLAPRARQIVERLRQRFPERQVDVEIDEAMPCAGDPRLVAVVLENLVENAWKFTQRTDDARIHVGMRQLAPDEMAFFVADNGAGFDMSYGDKLFKAFQRLHPNTEFEGTGIGLATVHRIVNRHGGRVWATSSLGQGATFHFTLGRWPVEMCAQAVLAQQPVAAA